MKKLFFIAIITLLVSCAPGKSGQFTRIDVYCQNCKIGIKNVWSNGAGKDHGFTIDYRGSILNYSSINIEKYDAPISCVQITEYENLVGDSITIFYIQNADTIGVDYVEPVGICY